MAFVTITGKTGKNSAGTNIVVVDAISKKLAIAVAEEQFRIHYKLPKSIALQCSIAFEGTKEECHVFFDKLNVAIDREREPA